MGQAATTLLMDFLNDVAQARDIVDVNVAAGIALAALRGADAEVSGDGAERVLHVA